LDVEVQGITKGGVLNLEICSSKEAFDIPPGTYAIKLHIDENENGELGTNFLGIPKEQYGTSNNLRFLDFEAASFVIDTHEKVQIDL